MIDQSSQFMAILTAVGEAKQANADAMNIPWTFSQMGVGDANGADPQPNRAQTKLINERRRAPLNQVKIDPKNTNVIIAEQVIPENVGGWWIREIGLYDADGDLVAVANCAPSFKPELAQGSGKTQVVRINFIVSSAANVTLKIDPSVVLATRQYVDDRIIEVLPPTRKPGSYTKVLIDKRGVVIEGSNPETLADNGIKDAYTKTQVNDLLQVKAPLDSPVLTGTPKAPTAPLTSNSQQLANTAFVQALVASLISGAPGALDTLKELADALGGDPNFANTIINALSRKVSREGDEMSGGLTLGNGTDVSPSLSFRDASGIGGFSLNKGVLRYIGYYGSQSKQLFSLDFNSGNVANARGALWDVVTYPPSTFWNTGNFNPASKADAAAVTAALATKADNATTLAGYRIGDAYTKTQTAQLVENAITALVGSSPEALNTLNELAAALGNNPNFATAINEELAKRVRNTGDTMTGPLTLAGLTTSSPSISFRSEEGIGSLNVYRQRLRYIGYYGSESKEIFSADFATGDVFNGRGALWDVSKYPPAQYLKVNQSLASGSNLHCGSGNSPYIASMTSETGSLEVHNEANSAASAVMLFHRKGIFGAYFGLDTDNQFKVGGLSMGANAYTVWHSGNAPKNTGSAAVTGWWRCADTGLMRMWGVTNSVGQDSAVAVPLPMTFPNAVFGVHFMQQAEMKPSAVGNYGVKDVTRQGFTLVNGNDGVGPCYWEAWGN